MTQFNVIVQGGTAEDLAAAASRALAPLLSHVLTDVRLIAVPSTGVAAAYSLLSITYTDGGSTITTPFQCKAAEGFTPDDGMAPIRAFMRANSSFFLSPTYTVTLDPDTRGRLRTIALVIYNTALANGKSNWSSGGVPTTRQIVAGTGLTGGGDLSADRTLALANTSVAAGAYGDATHVATFTVDAQGRLTAAGTAAISSSGGAGLMGVSMGM